MLKWGKEMLDIKKTFQDRIRVQIGPDPQHWCKPPRYTLGSNKDHYLWVGGINSHICSSSNLLTHNYINPKPYMFGIIKASQIIAAYCKTCPCFIPKFQFCLWCMKLIQSRESVKKSTYADIANLRPRPPPPPDFCQNNMFNSVEKNPNPGSSTPILISGHIRKQ